MKKFFITLLLFTFFLVRTNKVKAVGELAKNSKSAYLMETSTMRVIYEKNADERLAPASMTKIMTMILIMEAIESKKITWDDMVVTPDEASELAGSQIFLAPGEEMSVSDLVKSIAIASANDAAMSLAIYIGGSGDNFVAMMNDKVKELGLENTNFVNPYGFDDDNHFSTSKDIAIMSCYLINKYPEILNYTSLYEDYIRTDNPEKKFWLVNKNKLVKHYKGVDGLKTGWTDKAMYCLSCTLNKNGVRFVSVVMGCETVKLRQEDTMALLNYATNNYEVTKYMLKGDAVATFEDVRNQPMKYKVVLTENVNILRAKGNSEGIITTKVKIDNLKLKKYEEIVGTLEVYYDGKLYQIVNLTICEDVKKASFFAVFLEVLKEIFLVS